MSESKGSADQDSPKPSRKPARKSPTDDLSARLGGHKFSIESRETEQEQASRLRRKEARAEHELWRDRAILLVCLVSFPVLALGCLLILLVPGQTTEARTWASSILTALASGVVGYAFGK